MDHRALTGYTEVHGRRRSVSVRAPGGERSARGIIRAMPPIDELTRIEPVHLDRLDHQGIFTTGLLLEVSETPTRRQTLADQVARHDQRRPDVARRGPDAQPRELRAGRAPL